MKVKFDPRVQIYIERGYGSNVNSMEVMCSYLPTMEIEIPDEIANILKVSDEIRLRVTINAFRILDKKDLGGK